MELIHESDGLTVRQLRHLLGTIPEADADGNETLVFLSVGNMHNSIATCAGIDEDGDLVLISDHAQAVMEDLGTWEAFTSACE